MIIRGTTLSIVKWVTDKKESGIAVLGAIGRCIDNDKYKDYFISWEQIAHKIADPISGSAIIENCLMTPNEYESFNWWDIKNQLIDDTTIDKNEAIKQKIIDKKSNLKEVTRKEITSIIKSNIKGLAEPNKIKLIGLGEARLHETEKIIHSTNGLLLDIENTDELSHKIINILRIQGKDVISVGDFEDNIKRHLVTHQYMVEFLKQHKKSIEQAIAQNQMDKIKTIGIYREVSGKIVYNELPAMYKDIKTITSINNIANHETPVEKTYESILYVNESINRGLLGINEKELDILKIIAYRFSEEKNDDFEMIKRRIQKELNEVSIGYVNNVIKYIEQNNARIKTLKKVYVKLK